MKKPNDLPATPPYDAPSLVAVDFETSYEKGRDIKTLGQWKYLAHPSTDIYLVSFYGRLKGESFAWVGNPKEAPWQEISGVEWVSHNRTFDLACFVELQRRGIIAESVEWGWWHCSADLATYLQAPRSLAGAMKAMAGVELDKTTRDEMKGKTWETMTPEFREESARYALLDSKASFWLADTFLPLMPEDEREASYHTTLMVWRGLHVDLPGIEADLDAVKKTREEIEREIPWANSLNEKGKTMPVSSPLALKAECKRMGIPAPSTTDSKSPELDEWCEKFADAAPFVKAVGKWRSANRVSKLLQTLKERAFEDGRLPYGLKYGGAVHTLRWSGDSGLNFQNFPRDPVAGVDCRAKIVAKPGHVFVIGDLAQIEARVALWLVGDKAQLALIADGMDIYEAHARRTMGYNDPRPLKDVDKTMRQLAKCRVLALGFGLGGSKFKNIVKLWTGIEISEEESRQIVSDYRRANPGIVGAWRDLETALKATQRGGTYTTELPSGRLIRYFDVREAERGWQGRMVRGEFAKNLYGGLMFENAVQATARDIFRDAILRIEHACLPVVLHVHDEVIVEVPEADAEDRRAWVESALSAAPPWAEDLPIASSVHVSPFYCKD